MSGAILIVAPYLPWPADFGGAIRIYEFIRHLSRQRDVILLAPASRTEMAAISHLRDVCDVTAVPVPWTFRQPAGMGKRSIQARSIITRRSFVERASWHPQIQSVMNRLFMTRDIQLVQYEFPQMTIYRPLRPCPTVLDNHNIEHQLLAGVARTTSSLPQRVFNNIEWRKLRHVERDAWSRVSVNIATSEHDAAIISHATCAPVPVVPNGVDATIDVNLTDHDPIPGRVVFVGAMRHQPNADGARWYAERVHPLVSQAIPGASLEIVGADPPPNVVGLASGSIAVTGRVDDVRAHLKRASVAVVPLLSGGGTRLKILDAFAAGVPVVSTSLGAAGLDVKPNLHLLIADTPQGFADAVINVLSGVNLPPQYSTAHAHALAASTYDWETAIVPSLVNAHDEAIARFNQQNPLIEGSTVTR